MRRGWILILSSAVFAFGGGTAWWWSTPGQLWWMTKKWEWWVRPMLEDRPGGVDPWSAADHLEPQWSRLLGRTVVAPYLRAWDHSPTDEQLTRFWERMRSQATSPFPAMLSGGSYVSYQVDGKPIPEREQPPAHARAVLEVFLLLPPDQHAIIDTIGREVFGSEGRASTENIPDYWQPQH